LSTNRNNECSSNQQRLKPKKKKKRTRNFQVGSGGQEKYTPAPKPGGRGETPVRNTHCIAQIKYRKKRNSIAEEY
jgi:hypothetical protein